MFLESFIKFQIPLSTSIKSLREFWVTVKVIPTSAKKVFHFAGQEIVSFPQPNETIPGKFEIHINNSREMFSPGATKFIKPDRKIVFPLA